MDESYNECNCHDHQQIRNNSCSFCLQLAFNPVLTDCGHVFCAECLKRWVNLADFEVIVSKVSKNHTSCPCCRTPFNLQRIPITSEECYYECFGFRVNRYVESNIVELRRVPEICQFQQILKLKNNIENRGYVINDLVKKNNNKDQEIASLKTQLKQMELKNEKDLKTKEFDSRFRFVSSVRLTMPTVTFGDITLGKCNLIWTKDRLYFKYKDQNHNNQQFYLDLKLIEQVYCSHYRDSPTMVIKPVPLERDKVPNHNLIKRFYKDQDHPLIIIQFIEDQTSVRKTGFKVLNFVFGFNKDQFHFIDNKEMEIKIGIKLNKYE